jgi:hypothetical protein
MHGCVLRERERMVVDFCLRVSMHGVLIRRSGLVRGVCLS